MAHTLENGRPGRTNVVRHKLDSGGARPIRQAGLLYAKRNEAENIIQQMQQEDVIESPSGPWASPLVLVKKKDSYPLAWIDDNLNALG